MTDITTTIRRAIDWAAANQLECGAWNGRLESNCCMEAQWLLMQHVLGIDDDPKRDGVIEAILSSQREDGSWEVYYNAPSGDINTTVECYAALRANGFSADDTRLVRARNAIFTLGGLEKIRVFTQFWLALIGEWDWKNTPTLPPELILLPTWFPINIYRFASWARATILPLCILSARRVVVPLPPEARLDELFPNGRSIRATQAATPIFSIARLFLIADRFLSWYVRSPFQPFRETAIRLCREEILRHQDADGAWGGIQPPWVYSILALTTEGYAQSHPVIHAALDAFNHHWKFETPHGTFLQASDSIVWDTQLMLQGLLDCGETIESSPQVRRAIEWLLDQQITTRGDWCETVRESRNREGEYGGWAFERANLHYPDIDDTAVAVIVLARARETLRAVPVRHSRTLQSSHTAPPSHTAPSVEGSAMPNRCVSANFQTSLQQENSLPDLASKIDLAIKRSLVWLEMMQSQNGGWGAFDRDNVSTLVTKIPFCDFGEVLDPPSVDVTAHVVEAMALCGMSPNHSPSLRRAIKYIEQEQEYDGSWFGRWGVNYVYGTSAVLTAFAALGRTAVNDPRVARAAAWIAAHQNSDGGWGELPASYLDDAARGRGPSTASQTAWGLIALTAAHRAEDAAAVATTIARGAEFLAKTQNESGTWEQREFTGTGFPGYGVGKRQQSRRDKKKIVVLEQGNEMQRAFMINYHLYRHVFPLAALGRISESEREAS
ncbi:MAG: terpene cyclase/mutase family protein [Thermoguttaceae bacterium]